MKAARWCIAVACVLIAACASRAPIVSNAVPRFSQSAMQSSTAVCRGASSVTLQQLEYCIREAALQRDLTDFQTIADTHPDAQGHGNRDTGTPGYRASVDYIASRMRAAGYSVTIQPYPWRASVTAPASQLATAAHAFVEDRDYAVARGSAGGDVTSAIDVPRGNGCQPQDFTNFVRGRIAFVVLGTCSLGAQVSNAQAAGASAAIVYAREGDAREARLADPASIPVLAVASAATGAELLREYRAGTAPIVHLRVATQTKSGTDYNVIAESPYGDAARVVSIEAHLDSIYGAGILDNASGSSSLLEIALNLARTPTHNRLRYIWFGGEELGLFGSRYYTGHLTTQQRQQILFDVDLDVTATPNFDILIADPANAANANKFPPGVLTRSRAGNDAFKDFFTAGGINSLAAPFGNDGTDSNAFAVAGIPDSGVLTGQDCCKQAWEVNRWGGFRGDYEGKVPGFSGGCVDQPRRWCDNVSNTDPFVLEFVSKAAAYVTYTLANDASLSR